MDEFEVIERIEKAGTGETYILAIEFVKPTMIKFRSTVHLKKGDKLTLNDKEVFHGNDRVGEAFEKKSRDDVAMDREHDIKYTGGYSLDGKTIYLDEHFPRILKVEGKDINAEDTIGYHHELPEKWMSDEKYEYPYAHETATGIEKKYVEYLGVTWKGYCDQVDKNLRNVYSRTLGKSPSSLDLAPYLYCRDQEALKEIRNSEPEE